MGKFFVLLRRGEIYFLFQERTAVFILLRRGQCFFLQEEKRFIFAKKWIGFFTRVDKDRIFLLYERGFFFLLRSGEICLIRRGKIFFTKERRYLFYQGEDRFS